MVEEYCKLEIVLSGVCTLMTVIEKEKSYSRKYRKHNETTLYHKDDQRWLLKFRKSKRMVLSMSYFVRSYLFFNSYFSLCMICLKKTFAAPYIFVYLFVCLPFVSRRHAAIIREMFLFPLPSYHEMYQACICQEFFISMCIIIWFGHCKNDVSANIMKKIRWLVEGWHEYCTYTG